MWLHVYIYIHMYIYITIYTHNYIHGVYLLKKTFPLIRQITLPNIFFYQEAIALNRAELVRFTDGMKKHMRSTDVLLEGKLGWINGDRYQLGL